MTLRYPVLLAFLLPRPSSSSISFDSLLSPSLRFSPSLYHLPMFSCSHLLLYIPCPLPPLPSVFFLFQHVFLSLTSQIGGLNIQSTRNIYGRQISSFEGKIKLHDRALYSNVHSANSCACDEFHGVFIRAPGIARINSPGVDTLATLEDSENTMVAVRQGPLMATCFHPELTTDQRWHSYFLQMILNHKYPPKGNLLDS